MPSKKKQPRQEYEEYLYLSYHDMREKLQELKNKYPRFYKIDTAEDLFGIKHEVSCAESGSSKFERCQVDIVTLTDSQSPVQKKKQVYISGALHGDEILGPNAVYYFIEYFLNRAQYQAEATIERHLLENTEIILTPMTNAVGYRYKEREERLSADAAQKYGKQSVDINRDFPYNQKSRLECLKSKAARIVYQIFARNNIDASITFHGGDNVIGYPWGSYNWSEKYKSGRYKGYMTPDQHSFYFASKVLRDKAGEVTFARSSLNAREYQTGDMSSTIYPVHGGMEDWAYAASWDRSAHGTMRMCTPQTYPLYDDLIDLTYEDQEEVKALIFLVETDNHKSPQRESLGGRLITMNETEGQQMYGGIYQKEKVLNYQVDGHINRNIRLISALVEQVDPWIEIIGYSTYTATEKHDKDYLGSPLQVELAYDNDGTFEDIDVNVFWRVNGCSDGVFNAQYFANGESLMMMEGNDYDFKWKCYFLGNEYPQLYMENNHTTSIFMSSFKANSSNVGNEEFEVSATTDYQLYQLPKMNYQPNDRIRPENTTPQLDFSKNRNKWLRQNMTVGHLFENYFNFSAIHNFNSLDYFSRDGMYLSNKSHYPHPIIGQKHQSADVGEIVLIILASLVGLSLVAVWVYRLCCSDSPQKDSVTSSLQNQEMQRGRFELEDDENTNDGPGHGDEEDEDGENSDPNNESIVYHFEMPVPAASKENSMVKEYDQ